MNVKRIELYNLQYWSKTLGRWVSLQANDGDTTYSLGPASNMAIVLYDAGAGAGYNPINPFTTTLQWDYFSVNDGSGITDEWTIFGDSPLLPAATSSIRIRYKIRLLDMATPTSNVFEPDTIYYQIINLDFPENHIDYSSGGTSGPWAPQVTVRLPGVSASMADNSDPLHTWLTNPQNWMADWTRPDGTVQSVGPVGSPTVRILDSSVTEYGGAVAEIGLRLPSLPISQNGNHQLSIMFIPNDQGVGGGFVRFADTHTWTAAISVLMPNLNAPLTFSFTSNTYMVVNFAVEAPEEPPENPE